MRYTVSGILKWPGSSCAAFPNEVEQERRLIGDFPGPVHAAIKYASFYYARRGEEFTVRRGDRCWSFTVVSEKPLVVFPAEDIEECDGME